MLTLSAEKDIFDQAFARLKVYRGVKSEQETLDRAIKLSTQAPSPLPSSGTVRRRDGRKQQVGWSQRVRN